MRKLKFTLDRKTLEIIYTSFIRPVLEYADVVWGNCNQQEKNQLDKIQNEAGRIVTGTTKLISIAELNRETGWETLAERRRKHRLIMFYKMLHGLTPAYLQSLVPRMAGENSDYNLRNYHIIRAPMARSNIYYNSFLPSVIRDWNALPVEARDLDSVAAFKLYLNRQNISPPKYYYVGGRKAQILHSRLRTKCSALNADIYARNLVDSPYCTCGQYEDAYHFFLCCPLYIQERTKLLADLATVCTPNLETILFGNDELSYRSNESIFTSVQQFIIDSKRFL